MDKNGITMSFARSVCGKLSVGNMFGNLEYCFHHINKICIHIIPYTL